MGLWVPGAFALDFENALIRKAEGGGPKKSRGCRELNSKGKPLENDNKIVSFAEPHVQLQILKTSQGNLEVVAKLFEIFEFTHQMNVLGNSAKLVSLVWNHSQKIEVLPSWARMWKLSNYLVAYIHPPSPKAPMGQNNWEIEMSKGELATIGNNWNCLGEMYGFTETDIFV